MTNESHRPHDDHRAFAERQGREAAARAAKPLCIHCGETMEANHSAPPERYCLSTLPGLSYTPDYICGGSGNLTSESRAEIDAFRHHLVEHPKDTACPDCRFCAERHPNRPSTPPDHEPAHA